MINRFVNRKEEPGSLNNAYKNMGASLTERMRDAAKAENAILFDPKEIERRFV